MNRFEQKLRKSLNDPEFLAGYLEADLELRSAVLSVYASDKIEAFATAGATIIEPEDLKRNTFSAPAPIWWEPTKDPCAA